LAALDASGHRAVVDLRLPHASGVALVRRIRKLDQGRLPILVFSDSMTSAEEVRDLAALGGAGYFNEYSAVETILPSIAPVGENVGPGPPEVGRYIRMWRPAL